LYTSIGIGAAPTRQWRRFDRSCHHGKDVVPGQQPPEVGQQPRCPVTAWGGQDDVAAGGPDRQSGGERRIDVKQRQAAEHGLSGLRAQRGRHGPGEEDFVRLGVWGNLRRAGGAAGVEQAGDVVRFDLPRECEPGIGLAVEYRVEVMNRHSPLRRVHASVGGGGKETRRIHTQHVLEGLDLTEDRRAFCPQVESRRAGRQRHEQSRSHGAQDLQDLRRLEQRVDRRDPTRRLAAPDCKVRLRQVRQQVGHGLVGAESEAVEGVGRLGDARREFTVTIDDGLLVQRAAHQERQCRTLGVSRGARPQQVVSAALRVATCERN
jgi:hypothetical protein